MPEPTNTTTDYRQQVDIGVLYHDADAEIAGPIVQIALSRLTADLLRAGVKNAATSAVGKATSGFQQP